MHDIYEVMVSEVQELDDTLIFHTKIPLVDEEGYDVYQLTPIPVATQNYIYHIYYHRDRHFALSVEELNQCTQTNDVGSSAQAVPMRPGSHSN